MKKSRKKSNAISKMPVGLAKPAALAIIVVCLALAGIIFYWTMPKDSGGIGSIKRGEEMYWVKCNNPSCNAEYEMDKKNYYEQIREKQQANPNSMVTPPLTCEKCGKDSVYRAVKCEKCGTVFFYETDPDDFPDRCPKCSYSKRETELKARKAQRGG